MKQLQLLENLNGTVHQYRDPLVEGFCLTIDNEEFRIFVANEIVGNPPRGFFIKVMYHLGLDTDIDLDNKQRFPTINEIINRHSNRTWNTGRERHCYKFTFFGHNDADMFEAVKTMRQMVCEILMSSEIE